MKQAISCALPTLFACAQLTEEAVFIHHVMHVRQVVQPALASFQQGAAQQVGLEQVGKCVHPAFARVAALAVGVTMLGLELRVALVLA